MNHKTNSQTSIGDMKRWLGPSDFHDGLCNERSEVLICFHTNKRCISKIY